MADITNLVRRLDSIMCRLMETTLYKEHDVSEASLNNFEQILNLSIPVASCDITAGEVIRYLYKQNKSSWIKYMYINQQTQLALLTDGYLIVKVLKLKGVVYIKWDRTASRFDVKVSTDGMLDREGRKKLMNDDEYQAALDKISELGKNTRQRKYVPKRSTEIYKPVEDKKNYLSENQFDLLVIADEKKKSWADMADEDS